MNKSPTVSLRQRANNQAERLVFEPIALTAYISATLLQNFK